MKKSLMREDRRGRIDEGRRDQGRRVREGGSVSKTVTKQYSEGGRTMVGKEIRSEMKVVGEGSQETKSARRVKKEMVGEGKIMSRIYAFTLTTCSRVPHHVRDEVTDMACTTVLMANNDRMFFLLLKAKTLKFQNYFLFLSDLNSHKECYIAE